MSTIGDVVGFDPSNAEGMSLVPILSTRDRAPPERTLYWEHIGSRAIREGDLKLVVDRRPGAWELYDLGSDPTELRDLAQERPEESERLDALWQAWANDVGVFAHEE